MITLVVLILILIVNLLILKELRNTREDLTSIDLGDLESFLGEVEDESFD